MSRRRLIWLTQVLKDRIFRERLSRHSDVHFLVAAPRSGTTWMQTALNAHPSIYCVENRLFGEFCEIWPNNDGTSSPRITLDSVAKIYAGHIPQPCEGGVLSMQETIGSALCSALLRCERKISGKRIIIDKVTPYVGTARRVAQGIASTFPQARIVHLVRDGRDVLVSGLFHWIRRSSEGRTKLQHIGEQKRLLNDDFIDVWARMWLEVNSAMLGNEQVVHRLRYEELVTAFDKAFPKLLKAYGVDAGVEIVDAARSASAFEKMSGGRHPGQMDAASAARRGLPGDWRNWMTRRDGERFMATAGEALVEFGYAKDDWVSELSIELHQPRVVPLTEEASEREMSA